MSKELAKGNTEDLDACFRVIEQELLLAIAMLGFLDSTAKDPSNVYKAREDGLSSALLAVGQSRATLGIPLVAAKKE